MEKVSKEISKQLKENKEIQNSQHGFIKSNSCLTNLISFCDKMKGSVDGGKAADIVYLHFSKASDTSIP